MTIFNVLNLIGGLSLFLFGMSVMGNALEKMAGSKLRVILSRLTDNRFLGLLTGLGVTAVIQSSSATTVMVVGFVNSGLMTLKQSISVIMGANIGTTVTAWILSLAGISSDNFFVKMLKPSSFTPILALIGIIFYMFLKDNKKKDIGLIFLGFTTLMFGMETMSSSVSVLKSSPSFSSMFLMFTNPFLGVLAGALLTAIIQSSSASVGILQALALTGGVTYGAAVPIIMGQNIGTCITALVSSIGTNKNARRAAMVHLSFNIIGTLFFLIIFVIVKVTINPFVLQTSASMIGIAIVHSIFNVCCTIILFPFASLLEKIVLILIPDDKKEDDVAELDTRLFSVPSLALGQCRNTMLKMVNCTLKAIEGALSIMNGYNEDLEKEIKDMEDKTDYYEDIISTYLVNLSTRDLSDTESNESASYLKLLADFERIGDHAVGLSSCSKEIMEKDLEFSLSAKKELKILYKALEEVVTLTCKAFEEQNCKVAEQVEPLARVIVDLKEQIRMHHVIRLQQGSCSISSGFVLSDILTNIERTADHCSNIAGTVMEIRGNSFSLHENLREYRLGNDIFRALYNDYAIKYALCHVQ